MSLVSVIVDNGESMAKLSAIKAGVPWMMASMGLAAGAAVNNTLIPEVIREAPKDTGLLKVSIHGSIAASPNRTELQIHADAQNPRNGKYYAQFVIHGFRMTFFGRPDVIYPPNPFPERAYMNMLPVLSEEASQAAADAVRVMRIF